MGMNASADIFYGYVWEPEPGNPPWPDYDEEADEELGEWTDDVFAERVAKGRGHSDPWKAMPQIEYGSMPYAEQRAIEEQWVADHRSEIDAFYKLKDAIRAEFGLDKIEVSSYGSCEHGYTTTYIRVVGAPSIRADWGTPRAIEMAELASNEDSNGESWDTQLAHFAEVTGVDLTDAQGPGWFVVCTWG